MPIKAEIRFAMPTPFAGRTRRALLGTLPTLSYRHSFVQAYNVNKDVRLGVVCQQVVGT